MKTSKHFLDKFFSPKSVAIVGATNNPLKMNFRLVQNLIGLGFEGRIYPVNPRAGDILGVKAFSRLEEIPGSIDLVVSAIPASKTMDIVKQCEAIGVKRLVIITGGFSEGGEQGQRLHNEIAAFVKEKGIRILGPNTLSPVNAANNFVISYNPVTGLKQGSLSFAFQSGFYDLKLGWLCSHIGISKMIDMGNKMDINEVDALEYLSQDPDTRVIAMHIESLRGNGRDFYNLLKETSMEKPVIILKSGRTEAGSRAAASHTGALSAGNDVIFDSMLKQTAAIRAQNIEEFFDLAKAFEFLELPQGNRLAIIALSGGEGVMATDACELSGLELARISEKTYHKLEGIFPSWEIPLNPLDAGVCIEFHLSDLHTFFDTLSAIPADEEVDCTIMQMPPPLLLVKNLGLSDEQVESLRRQYVQMFLNLKGTGKPFALWCSSMDDEEEKCAEMLESSSLPVFRSAERAIRALSCVYQYRQKVS